MKKIICLLILLCLMGCSNTSNHNCEMFTKEGYEVPAILGESLGFNTKDDVSTYIDALLYAKKNLKEYEGYVLVEKILDLIKDDYAETSIIYALCGSSDYNYLMYVKVNDKYVLLDPVNQISNKKWFSECDIDQIFDTYEQLEQSIYQLKFDSEITKVSRKKTYILLDDNCVYEKTYRSNVPLINYESYNVPEALGPQIISDDEMKELIKNDNNDKVASTITTVADAINYMIKKGYGVDKAEDGTHYYMNLDYVDAGNLHYNDEWIMYTAPGLELLGIKNLQCSSSCSLMKYLIEGDYPEVGYIYSTAHAMLYVKAFDDKYYLVQPSDYLEGKLFTTWEEKHVEGDVFCADTLKEIIDAYAQVREREDKEPLLICTYCYDGTICCGTLQTPGPEEKHQKHYFPIGSDPICWYGDIEVEEFVPKHDTSQNRIIGLPNLKYFDE